MAELNRAYAVLSDPRARAAYDKDRATAPGRSSAFHPEAPGEVPEGPDPLEEDWSVAVKYYPDLLELEKGLASLSWRLAFAYRTHVLAAKAFASREKLARQMEKEFLELYFGSDPTILQFARALLHGGHGAAAKALNMAVRVLGQSAVAARVIENVSTEFGLTKVRKPSEICPYCGGSIQRLADYCLHCHRRL